MARKPRIEAFDTVSFTNWLFEFNVGATAEEHKQMLMDSMEYHGARRKFPRDGKILSPVEFAKWALGKQDYTWTGSYRNWVWERGLWRLFVNNHQGFSLEVKEGLTIEQAREVWNEVRARLGVFDMFPHGTHVLVYADDEPGVSLGPDPKWPGHFHVNLENGKRESVHLDNIRKAP
jgi:hypothetical protein